MIVSFFSSAYSRHPTVMEMTRAEFFAMCRDSATERRQVSDQAKRESMMLSPAIYDAGGKRRLADAQGAEFTALDFDEGDWTVFAAAAWCRAHDLAHVVYTTAKSRPAHHRFRLVLFFTRRLAASEYRAAWEAIARMMPAVIDPATKDITRLSIAPYKWEGAFNHLVAADGSPLDIDDVMRRFAPPPPPPQLPPAVRTQPLSSAYAEAALAGEEDRVRSARPGTRNATLHRAAFSLGQLVAVDLLERRVVEDALSSASSLPSYEATAAIRGGIESGMRHPRR
ncbi:hypothetical protein C8J45_11911 [Sphingomonas sp. PP-CE-3G-477]|uniref:hypothetical protein n=1 Tax=Sphingomonas sp. PP-CE-3G-477 TaxID=2135660 RepID=UPI000D333FA3|nr:hypothetical protein [Sphingomonas sp. PP-CE-3G-477]PTQ58587.1 hypothetical protein C8J45_11911 [Sphingomonas sp. PP-CE-3G-477]